MISRFAIREFKCLQDVSIDLERFTVLVGPNASGKSSILQALDLLCRSFGSSNPVADGELIPSRSRGSTAPVELAAESGGTWYRYRTSATSPVPLPLVPSAEWNGDGRGATSDPGLADWKRWQPGPSASPSLPVSRLLLLETSRLINPQPGNDPTSMEANGTGLHPALASMALNDPDSWQELQADLHRIIPTIRRLRHTPAVWNQPHALLFDSVNGDSIPASQVSEGTLLVLGLLAALHGAGRPDLMLLDDLERGLHPRAQNDLIALLRRLMMRNPDLQIVATTHSPYLLDCMRPSEVRMTILGEDGATVCEPLARHPRFEKWKDEMAPGEMWSLFGEKWLLQPETASP